LCAKGGKLSVNGVVVAKYFYLMELKSGVVDWGGLRAIFFDLRVFNDALALN
jgi:hypothetical protein